MTQQILDESAVDVFVLYQFVKKITTPFTEWPAYKLGIIDKDGNTLRKRSTLSAQEERNAFTVFDVLIRNIKRIIEKIPGGKSKLSSYIAGLYLIKEEKNASWYQDEDIAYESFIDFYEKLVEHETLEIDCKILLESVENDEEDQEDEELEEDAPVNSVAGGGVAGLTVATGGPVIRNTPKKRKKKKVLRLKEYIE